MMFTTLRLRTYFYALGVLCICAAGFFALAHAQGTAVDSEARAIVASCAKSGTDHSACYESEVPSLYPKYDVASIFDIVREIRQLDPSYQFCHVLGHKIGERVVAEDPDKWVDAIPLNPTDGLCSNGFIHGVIGGRFRSEVLDDATIQKFMPDFKQACEAHDTWQPSDLDRAMCYHAMGHLFDYITNADITKALSLCTEVAPSDYQRVCVQGVFMQIYQPLEPDDYALIAQMPVKPSTTTVQTYCARFSSDTVAQGACIEESWPFQQPHITDGTAVQKLCSWEPNSEEAGICYISMSSIIGRMTLGNPTQAVQACSQFPADQMGTCFSYSAEAVLEESRTDASPAIALCNRAPESVAGECLSTLVSHAQFMFGSNEGEMRSFCAALPSAYQEGCGTGNGGPVAPIISSDTIER